MRELIDCHIHTARSGHGGGSVAQMVGAAVFGGLGAIVMSEHLPLPHGMDPEHHLGPSIEGLAEYADEVRETAARVKGLEVVLGAEADWLPERADEARGIQHEARRMGIEVLLGSVHFLGNWAFDNPHDLSEWDRRDTDEVWAEYFAAWCDAARSGLFDVMAHPDLVKKFGHRPSFDPRELYMEAARAAADGDVLIELSTAGLRKPVGEMYPGPELLTAFREAGVEVCVGSDAHSTEEVGWGVPTAYDALQRAGYERVALPRADRDRRWVEL